MFCAMSLPKAIAVESTSETMTPKKVVNQLPVGFVYKETKAIERQPMNWNSRDAAKNRVC